MRIQSLVRRLTVWGIGVAVGTIAFVAMGGTPVMAQEYCVSNEANAAVVFNADTFATVAAVPLAAGLGTNYDVAVNPTLTKAFVSRSNNIWVIDLTTNPPSVAAGTNPIVNPIGGIALDLTVTPNGQYVIVSDGSGAVPLGVINAATHAIVGTFNFLPDHDSVEACEGGSVLVTSIGSDIVRRLTIDANGTLANTGQQISIPTDPNNVVCAPGGLTGVAVNRAGTIQLTSFLLNGMTLVSNQPLAGNGLGINIVISSDGTKVIGRRATDFVTAYNFNAATGVIGSQIWSTNVGSRPTYFGVDQLSIHPNGQRVFANIAGQTTVLNANTGAVLGAFAGQPNPTGVACRLGSPTAALAAGLLDGRPPNNLDGTWCDTGQARLQFVITNATNPPIALADLPTNEFVVNFTSGATPINCTASSGTCVVSGNQVIANHSIPVGGAITIVVTFGVPSVLPLMNVSYTTTMLYALPGQTATPSTGGASLTLRCSNTVDPNRQLGCQVHLPILNFEGQDDVCETWIEVQVIACEAHKAVLVTWGEPGFCPPQAAGPLKVECTGLLRPGSTWNLLGAQIPTGSKGGMLFKFSARQLLELGIDLGFDDVVADLMCETLFFGIVGDADDYRRFKKAYNEGIDFAGIPQNIAMGDGFLAVDVLRKCPGDVTPGVRVTSKYNGIAGTHLGYYDPVFGGYAYYVPLLYADKGGAAAGAGGFNSIMYIQNGGLECSSVEIWFKAQDDCLRAKICEIFTLAPGETYQFDSSDCVGPDWQGSAWLRSSQPLGVAVDIIGRDVLMTYIGEPAEINYTYDPEKPFVSEGDQVAYGPLTYSEYQGWDSGVQVQNLSGVVNAKVKVYFYDRSGDIITTLVDWICPRGSQTFFLPVVHDLPGSWVGWVRVESQEWVSPGSPLVLPPNIVGVVTLIKYNDAARTETREAIAYNLLPEHKAYDWQLGYAGGGTASGIALIAIPSLLKDLDGTGVTSELAIANLVPKPGKTDFAIFIFDQNGLLDYVCQVLNDRQVEYIDFQTWGYVNPGFKGSAIISATFWEHDVFDGGGRFVRNLVGLAAVAVERTGTRLGEDTPGDESAGDRGIPFSIGDLSTLLCLDRFTGGIVPFCPGQPGTKLGQNCIVGRFIAGSTDTPRNLADAVVTNDIITVALPSGCLIADVNVWLSMFHSQQMVDWLVDLTGPSGATVRLFGQICGPGAQAGNIRAVIDDEGTPPIGNTAAGAKCPPDDFRRYGLQAPTATNRLSIFDGTSPNGNWRLAVTDQNVLIPGAPVGTPNIQNDGGTLFFWELQFDLQ